MEGWCVCIVMGLEPTAFGYLAQVPFGSKTFAIRGLPGEGSTFRPLPRLIALAWEIYLGREARVYFPRLTGYQP